MPENNKILSIQFPDLLPGAREGNCLTKENQAERDANNFKLCKKWFHISSMRVTIKAAMNGRYDFNVK
jgi:hypothetical protein